MDGERLLEYGVEQFLKLKVAGRLGHGKLTLSLIMIFV